ncbi:MAG: hypothetical protein KatS3mg087_0001 [Patescibacteria group bacterium]|nr:MAG: hypothetical protein KatS3mg087_0001 [Patescibacteria group bacterium]
MRIGGYISYTNVYGYAFRVERDYRNRDLVSIASNYIYIYRDNVGLLQWNLKTGDLKLLRFPFVLEGRLVSDHVVSCCYSSFVKLIVNETNPHQVLVVFKEHLTIDELDKDIRGYNQVLVLVDFQKQSIRFLVLRNYHPFKLQELTNDSKVNFRFMTSGFESKITVYEYNVMTFYPLHNAISFSDNLITVYMIMSSDDQATPLWVCSLSFDFDTGEPVGSLTFDGRYLPYLGTRLCFVNKDVIVYESYVGTHILIGNQLLQVLPPRFLDFCRAVRLYDVTYLPPLRGFIGFFDTYYSSKRKTAYQYCVYIPLGTLLENQENVLEHSYYLIRGVFDDCIYSVPLSRVMAYPVRFPSGRIAELFELAEVCDSLPSV